MHKNWRDCKELKATGLDFSCTNNEAVKLYDALLTQYVGWYDDASMGGIDNCMTQIIETDPEFVMGHVLTYGMDLMGTGHSPRLDPTFRQNIDNIVKLSGGPSVTPWEKKHVHAMDLFSKDRMFEACDIWEDILVDQPYDMLALKFAHDAYFYLGHSAQIRDSPARVMARWKPDMPLYGYLYGMHSFGLEETNLFPQAEKAGLKALEINKHDAWATHALAHVYEMMGRQNDGIGFLSKTVADWDFCGMLACHNFWHWAVYHIEKGECQGAVDIFDSQVGPRCVKSGAMLDIVDACSLLYRLEFEGVKTEGRWGDIYETCRPHIDDHILTFNDVHILMSCLGVGEKDTTQKMMDSLTEFISECTGDNRNVAAEVGATLCESFISHKEGHYGTVVDLIYPIRYKIGKIGGSNAQRDLFNLFLINAALKSPKTEHHRLARHLLTERKALKENAPMTDRLMGRAMALHAD